jgi:hypothetical protein
MPKLKKIPKFEIKNYSKSDINSEFKKSNVTSNSLDVNNCLFTSELLTCLIKGNKDITTFFKHCSYKHSKVFRGIEGLYLIVFRILNKEKRSLVYNYIYYNDLLYLTLIVYFMVRNYFIVKNDHEWGKYLVVLDNIFLNYDRVDKYIDLYNTKDKRWNKY